MKYKAEAYMEKMLISGMAAEFSKKPLGRKQIRMEGIDCMVDYL